MVNADEAIAIKEEADNLGLHVQMCSIRYNRVIARLDRQDQLLISIRTGVWGAVVALCGMGGAIYTTGATVISHLAGIR